MVAEVRHGVKVEIEGLTREDRLSSEQSMPAGEQMLDFPRGDPGGIFGQKALFGHGVETAEQRQPLVSDQRHDVALALDRPQLESQRGAERVFGWIMRE